MTSTTLTVSNFANGGAAVGRDAHGQTLFVPFAIPGERVRVTITADHKGYSWARLDEVLQPSADRVAPRCPHFGSCGGCQFQHLAYAAQLQAKQAIVADQMQRIGGFQQVTVHPTLPNPAPWGYQAALALSPVDNGRFGLWSPAERQVIPISACPISHPDLVTLLQDIDLDLPGLRRLTLHVGDDGDLLAALEVDGVEPPELEVDFPISVAIVLPDRTAATLIGDPYTLRSVRGREFRVSPGCTFQPSSGGAALVVETLLRYAGLTGTERVLELYSGVGMLTAFLAAAASLVAAIEQNGDAVADTAVNLADQDNVYLYQGWVEAVLPELELAPPPALAVVNPPDKGMSREALAALAAVAAPRLIYVSSDVATLARDGKQLQRDGYRLREVQPIDTRPQTYQVETVSVWTREA